MYDALIVICNSESMADPYVLKEIEIALEYEAVGERDRTSPVRVIPVLLDDCLRTGWQHRHKMRFSNTGQIDFQGWQDPLKYQVSLERLVALLADQPVERSHNSDESAP